MMLKNAVMAACQKNDFLYLRLKALNRNRIYWMSVVKRYLRDAIARPQFDADKVLFVSPESIRYKSTTPSNKIIDCGRILKGDWDRNSRVPFDKYIGILDAMRDLCLKNKEWTEIPFFKRVAEKIVAGEIHWGCRNVEELGVRAQKLKDLFADIKNNGYKTQEELHGDSPDRLIRTCKDEVSVHIGRDGEMLFGDGAHRLAIAKLLKLPEIPVRVVYRHPKWAAFLQEIVAHAKSQGGKLYHPVTHPDLADIPVAHKHERIDIIRPHLPETPGTVLDIGANWGYFCHKLEDLGFDCYAVEMDKLHFHFLRRLARATQRRFQAFNVSIFDFKERSQFEVVLALNIFHHFIKTKETHQKLVEFLNRTKTDVIFFQPHLTSEFADRGYYRNYANEEFVEFVLKHSGLTKYSLLGKARDGRPIYKLED